MLCASLLAACKSTPKVDWNARVGNFTFDQAVIELGPPDKTAELTDGSRLADWIQRRSGMGISFGFGTGHYGSSSGVGTGVGVGREVGGGERYLRLIFGKDGQLQRWEKGP
jgi:hypothetical protein